MTLATTSPRRQTIGIDLDDKRSFAVVLDRDDEVLREMRLGTTRTSLASALAARPACRIAVVPRVGRIHFPDPQSAGAGMKDAVRVSTAAECLDLEKESCGALHRMRGGLADHAEGEAWAAFEESFRRFEGPCERVVPAGTKPAGVVGLR